MIGGIMIEFNVGVEFSKEPSGRFYTDSDDRSGEAFREKFLHKKLMNLKEKEKITIILDDGIEGYGSSFLTEGFAGIVKYGYMTAKDLLEKLEFSYSDPDFEFYENKIKQYIKEAKYNSKEYKSTVNK